MRFKLMLVYETRKCKSDVLNIQQRNIQWTMKIGTGAKRRRKFTDWILDISLLYPINEIQINAGLLRLVKI